MTKEARICNGIKTAPSISGHGENWTATCKKKKKKEREIKTFPNTIYKNKLKWIKYQI